MTTTINVNIFRQSLYMFLQIFIFIFENVSIILEIKYLVRGSGNEIINDLENSHIDIGEN